MTRNHRLASPTPDKRWRGGMVGAGVWSETQLNAWAGVNNAEIVALCDRHPERRTPMARRFNISRTFDDCEEMLDAMELDFVDICVRPYSHASLVKLVAGRGLPVLCQKPFCTSLEEVREIVAFCESAGVRLMINENFRWQAWYRKAREVLQSGVLGEPFFARLTERNRLTLPKFDHRQAYFAEMPRLIVYEMGVHYLDTFRFLFGEPETVYARTHHVSPFIKGEDVQVIMLRYPVLTALINHSWASVPLPVPRLEIDGSEGTLALLSDDTMRLFTDSGQEELARFSRKDTVEQSRTVAQQRFINCLETGAAFETSGSETLKTMALVWASYLSAEEGRAISVADPHFLCV